MDILSVILSGRADGLGVTRAVDTAVWEGRLMQGLGLSYDFSPLLLDRLHSCRSSVLPEHLSWMEING